MKTFLLTLCASLTLSAALPTDFAYVRPIDIRQNGTFITFELPLSVYKQSHSAQLNDLAVIDAEGKEMPFRITTPHHTEEKSEQQPLPFSPYEVITKEKKEGLTLHYAQKSITLNSYTDLNNTSYIVDASAMKEGIDTLSIISDEPAYMTQVKVAYSNDLKHWSRNYQGTIAKLQMQGSEILEEKVSLHIPSSRYLNIQIQKPLRITTIIAHKAHTYEQAAIATPIQFTRATDEGTAHIDFEMPTNLRLDKLTITLPQGEQFFHFNILKRDSLDTAWKSLLNASFYRLKNSQLLQDTVTLNTTAKYYRVVPAKGYYLPKELTLSFTYAHKCVTFIAQGIPPYHLYYGSLRAKTTQSDFSTLTLTPLQASLGEETVMNAEALKAPQKPLEKRALLVWISLIIGVIVLGFLSYRLLQENNSDMQ